MLVADLMYADFADVFTDVGIEHVVVTRLNDYMPWLKKLLAPMLKFKKQQRAAGKPWPPVPKDAPVVRWHQGMRESGPIPPVATVQPREDLAVLIYTGGTTGIAKGAMLSHANLCANARQAWAWLTTIEEGRDAVLAAMPYFHSYGLLAMVLTGLIAAKLVPVPNPRDIHLILEISQEEKPTFFPGVPRLYVAINEFPDVQKFDLKSVKACVSGAAPLPQAVARRFARGQRRRRAGRGVRPDGVLAGDPREPDGRARRGRARSACRSPTPTCGSSRSTIPTRRCRRASPASSASRARR